MKTTIIFPFLFVVMFLIAASVKAGTVTDLIANGGKIFVGASTQEAYIKQAGAAKWVLYGAADFNKEKEDKCKGTFTLTNVLDDTITQKANYFLTSYDGMGAGYAYALTGVNDSSKEENYYGGMHFSHNSANKAAITDIPTGLLNSFFFNVGTHANTNSTQGTFNIVMTTSSGSYTYNDIEFGFVGFILGYNEYLTGFEIKTNGNKNTGFWFDFVPGNGQDPSTATPEPATLAIIGLGLVGLGLVRRKMVK